MDRPVPDPLAAFAAPRAPRLADALAQRGLRLAFRLMRLWWFLRRPPYDGALVALWHGGRILLIRHSYRDLLGLPGGGIGRREAPEAAARRELLEEVGCAAGRVELIGRFDMDSGRMQTREYAFFAPDVRVVGEPTGDEPGLEVVFVSARELRTFVQEGHFRMAGHLAVLASAFVRGLLP